MATMLLSCERARMPFPTFFKSLLMQQTMVVAALVFLFSGILNVGPPAAASGRQEPWIHLGDSSLVWHTEKETQPPKIVMVVIDALRADHLATATTPRMPHLHKMLRNGEGVGFIARTANPTVTLPRIKSLVTGTIPGFMDVVLNFGATELTEDNIIQGWVDKGQHIYFYGDDTWLKLFPTQFKGQDGVTSFFVTDYTEVDENVTRHISKTFDLPRWDVVILHYLGLDHIGHLAGPTSPLIGPKLKEMDTIIDSIHKHLEKKGDPYLLMICGDHGMSDAGGHGGASASEVTTSLFFLSNLAIKRAKEVIEVHQTDVASTLALLTGQPVPRKNIGNPIGRILDALGEKQQLLAHYKTTLQLYGLAITSGLVDASGDSVSLFREAVKLHKNMIRKNVSITSQNIDDVERIKALYVESQKQISKSLQGNLQNYDLPVVLFANSLIVGICLLNLIRKTIETGKCMILAPCLLWAVALWSSICLHKASSQLCPINAMTVGVFLPVLVYVLVMISSINLTTLKNTILTVFPLKMNNPLGLLLKIGSVLHVVSLLGSSLVEEEHQTIYFLSTTFHVAVMGALVTWTDKGSSEMGEKNYKREEISDSSQSVRQRKLDMTEDREPEVESNEKHSMNVSRTNVSFNLDRNFVYIVLSLVLSRFLRVWNATGNKWNHLEDFGDWLRTEGGSLLEMTVIVGLSIYILALYQTSPLLVMLSAVGIWGRHYPLIDAGKSSGKWEAQYVYCMSALCLAVGIFHMLRKLYFHYKPSYQKMGIVQYLDIRAPKQEDKANEYLKVLLLYTYTSLCMVCLLLQRVDNVLLTGLSFLQNLMFSRGVLGLQKKGIITHTEGAISVHWLALAHFFYQGNSNSLTTVDVSTGFIGMESYQPVFHGLLITIHTFGGLFLTYLCHLQTMSQLNFPSKKLYSVLQVWWSLRLGTVALYCCCVTAQRHHLFIWSVFMPKLLYEGAHVVCIITLSLLFVVLEKIASSAEFRWKQWVR
ncbi:GPI ethanolamine phosphate transferase 2, catalytic subunit-like isoform X2 [Oratosquilla oratoria]